MSAQPKIRVMLVDDHAVARAGYRFLLDNLSDISVVGEAQSGEDALGLYPELKPDVVILDLTMPGIGGRETLAQLKVRWPDIRVLVCTMHETTALIDHTLQAGAAGYISKNSSPEVLVTAVRKIAAGQKYIDAELAQTMLTPDSTDKGAAIASLSAREFRILCLFAEARSLDEIAGELSLSSKTVANYLTVIKEKLHVSSTPELVRLAISKGLVTV